MTPARRMDQVDAFLLAEPRTWQLGVLIGAAIVVGVVLGILLGRFV